MVIHQGERSKALPNAHNEPTGPSAPAAAQPLIDDDDVDNDDGLYKRNDESRFDIPLKQPHFANVLIDDKPRVNVFVDDLLVPPVDPNVSTTTSTTTLTSYKQRSRLTSKRRRQLRQQSTNDTNHNHNNDPTTTTTTTTNHRPIHPVSSYVVIALPA